MKLTFNTRAAALFSVFGLLSTTLIACGDDPATEPDTTCGPDDLVCPCEDDGDCPTGQYCPPAVLQCTPIVDAGGTTDAGDTGTSDADDASDDADAAPDVDTVDPPDIDDAGDTEDPDADTTPEDADGSDDVDSVDDTDTAVNDIDTTPEDVGNPASIDDNPWVAYVVGGGLSRKLHFTLADGSETRVLTSDDVSFQSPVFSPDCSSIAYIGASIEDDAFTVRIVDLSDGSVRSTPEQVGVFPQELSWSANGQTIALIQNTSGTERALQLLNVSDLSSSTRLADRRVANAKFGILSSTLFIRATESLDDTTFEFYTLGLTSGAPVRVEPDTESASIADFAVGPDDNLFAFQRNDGGAEFAIWNADRDRYTDIGDPQDGDPAFFADGERLAIVRIAGSAPNIFVVDLDGEVLQQLTSTAVTISEPTVCRLDAADVDISGATELLE